MHISDHLCRGAYYLLVQQSTTCVVQKVSCNLAQLLFDLCQSSKHFIHFLRGNFFCNKLRCSCNHFVLRFHGRQFLLNILKQMFQKYFNNSIYAFMGNTSLFSRDKIYSIYQLFTSLILVNTGSYFKCVKTVPKGVIQCT